MKMSTAVPGPGQGFGDGAAGGRSCLISRPAATGKVERPAGPNDIDPGEDRCIVALVAGAADRLAKSRIWDWKSCRAA
jgi:hypothetical protein